MQAIKARFDGDVFIPLEPFKSKAISRVFIVIEGEGEDEAGRGKYPSATQEESFNTDKEFQQASTKMPFWKLPEEERVKIAYKKYKKKFPDSEPDMGLLKLVGILPPMTDEEIRESYYQHLLRKHVK